MDIYEIKRYFILDRRNISEKNDDIKIDRKDIDKNKRYYCILDRINAAL